MSLDSLSAKQRKEKAYNSISSHLKTLEKREESSRLVLYIGNGYMIEGIKLFGEGKKAKYYIQISYRDMPSWFKVGFFKQGKYSQIYKFKFKEGNIVKAFKSFIIDEIRIFEIILMNNLRQGLLSRVREPEKVNYINENTMYTILDIQGVKK